MEEELLIIEEKIVPPLLSNFVVER